MTVKNHKRMDLHTMPRDRERSTATVNKAMAAAFNYARKYPRKMQALKASVTWVLKRINAWEEEYIDQEAERLGLDLDDRMSLKNKRIQFEELKAAKVQADKEAAEQARVDAEAASAEAAQKALEALGVQSGSGDA